MERAAELPFLCETEANPPAVTLACPDGFMLLGESCYAFRAEVRLSWDDSQEYCRNLTGQARLIEIETEQELHLITTFLRDNGTTTPYFWIGVEQRGESTHYQWASTKWPLTFYNWDDNQPNEVGSGNAIELYKKADCEREGRKFRIAKIL
ncbi:unnamed protein product [Cyprideis torosa]|uniref:Uncharacterized protein n=1 Tax=Cyprideis torosa TaxID=163714 RepID=A0A7R8ZVH6_9CRUS|nr:unnamed protein product [Cyprideis torosa]CAG0910709.1 unnamed protein product [Cyprideis torosa]